MRMESKDTDECKQNGTSDLQDICNGSHIVKSLSIQRCHSDGVLMNGNTSNSSDLASCKSSSDSSLNGAQDSSSASSCQEFSSSNAYTNTIQDKESHSPRPAPRNLSPDIFEPVHWMESTSKASAGSCDVVRPKTWSQRVVEKKNHKSKVNKRKRKTSSGKHLSKQMNGLELNDKDKSLPVSDYSRNVCDLYRQETDLIFGRTRGGTRNSNDPTVHVLPDYLDSRNQGLSFEAIKNRGEETGKLTNSIRDSSPNEDTFQAVVAPLALPESFSDEELLIPSGSSENEVDSGGDEGLDTDRPHNYLELLSMNNASAHNGCDESSSHTTNVCIGAQCMQNLTQSNADHVSQINEVGRVDENDFVEARARTSSFSSLESLDDAGDFIEADLPPNVERLAFFARGSSTEEDEGCGDEVLPSNNNGEDSENETIDPLTSGLVAGRRWNAGGSDSKVLNNNGASNSLSNSPGRGEGDLVNVYSNIVCNNSIEDNDKDNISTENISVGENENVEFSMCNQNFGGSRSSYRLHFPSVTDGTVNGGSNINGDSNCVCCDIPVEAKFQRIAEIGVIVCDKCFNELDIDKHRKLDNGMKRKTKSIGLSSSNNHKLAHRNNNMILTKNSNSEKVSNTNYHHNRGASFRLSSSDSEPFERLYVSDSSEVMSPDVDAGSESVFPSSTAPVNERAFLQLSQMANERTRKDSGQHMSRATPLHRQAASLDYDMTEEVLYCPYYSRRSRSLDQDLSFDDLANRQGDGPNIMVSSSNFQEDESNNQEKVFEKQAYLRACNSSSSDDEENTRVPQDERDEYPRNHQSAIAVGPQTEADSMEMMFVKATNGSMPRDHSRPEEEPIYEDIDDLELMLEDSSSEAERRSPATRPLCNAISKLRRKKRPRSPVSDVEKVMIWNEYEAYVVQVKQIGTSACGPTAVLNVLKAFDFQVDKEEVCQTIQANLRMEAAPIPYYLFSRYSAGTTAQALVEGVATVTRGTIQGRFFHFYPQRDVELLKWLGQWMKKGAVPVATLNLQRGVKPGWTIPDAWHHQMVYGVSSKGVYLTNPLEIVQENVILEQLNSDSVLLVRRQDVVSRFRDWCPLNELLKQPDPRWRTLNVLGQIVHMLREQCMPPDQLTAMKGQLTSHISIPAVYKAGIILFVRANTDVYDELMSVPELPVKPTQPNTQQP